MKSECDVKKARRRAMLLLCGIMMLFSVSVAMAKSDVTKSTSKVVLKYGSRNQPIYAQATFKATLKKPLLGLFGTSAAGTSGRCDLSYADGSSVGCEYLADGNARGLSTFFSNGGVLAQYLKVSPSWSVPYNNVTKTKKVQVSGGVYDGSKMIGSSVNAIAE